MTVINPSSKILPVSVELQNAIHVANRVVRFILDGSTQYATGILVGPSQVLTAAHLFFTSTGEIIDPGRIECTTVGVGARFGNLSGSPDECFIDPPVLKGVAQREVRANDFSIVKLDTSFGTDTVGDGETRGWFAIPSAAKAPALSEEMPVRVFQYVKDELRIATGFLRTVAADGRRVPHTASTVSGASGAPLCTDDGTLVAMHVSGARSGVVPLSNYAIPLATIARAIETPDLTGVTARDRLSASAR